MSPLLPLQDTRLTWGLYLCFLAVLTALCFGSLGEHLLDTHDADTFQDHLRISQDWTLFFSPDKTQASGRPLAEVVKYLAYLIWGNHPGAFHLLVVAAHTLASLMWAWVCRRLGLELELSLVTGLLFLVNVAHFQAIHHISALDYPLALICSLVSLSCYLYALRSGSWKWWPGFYGGIVLGLMAHLSSGVVVVFCLYWSWREGYSLRVVMRHLLPLGGLLVPVLAWLLHLASAQTSTWRALELYGVQEVGELVGGMIRVLLWFVSRVWTTAHWLPLPAYRQEPWEWYAGGVALLSLLVLVWKKHWPLSLGAAWIILSLLPFLLLTETTIRDLPAGPSRYLYLATAGSSLFWAWGLQQVGKRLGRWGHPLALMGLVTLLVSSYIYLKKTEALSFYTSGRNYIAHGEIETGIAQLRRAIARGPALIPLQDAYSRLSIQFIGTDEFEPFLSQALQKFPDDFTLNVFRDVAQSMSPDSSVRQPARDKIARLVNGLSGVSRRNAERGIAQGYANMGLKFDARGEHEQAIAAYGRALEFDPENLKNHRRLISALFETGRREEATALTLRAAQLDPENPDNRYLAALALRLQGRIDEAIAAGLSLLETHPSEELYTLLGECYIKNGMLEEARAVYQQALSHFPDHPSASLHLAELARAQGDPSGAIAALEEAIRLDPQGAVNYYNLGNLYYTGGRLDQAAKAYREAIRLDFRDPRVYNNLGTALRGLSRLGEAVQAYQQAIQLQPDNPALHHSLAGVFLEQGDRPRAGEAFALALALGYDNIETYLSLARLHLEEGRLEPALQLYRQILDKDLPNATGPLYTRLGIHLDSLGRLDEAMAAYGKALDREPGNAAAHTNLGWDLYRRGDLPGAIDQYRRALALGPNSVAQFNLGLAYLRLGKIAEARAAYAEAVAQFGAAEAGRIGAVEDLRRLIAQGVQTAAAQQLLDTYWK